MNNEIYAIVKNIPRGKVMSYGQVGEAITPRVPALWVGRAMASAPTGVPWWRVVGADGALPIHKRDPLLAQEQRERLLSEDVPFVELSKVDIAKCRHSF